MEEKKPQIRHIYCGLVWPDKGFPAYYCFLGEKLPDETVSFDSGVIPIQILGEGKAESFAELKNAFNEAPKQYIKTVFTLIEPKFANYIKEFNQWKREERVDSSLRKTKNVSFEASILKIKELVKEKRLIPPFQSTIRTQLASFAKENLGDEAEFYAIRALACAIWAFDGRKPTGELEEIPKLSAWW